MKYNSTFKLEIKSGQPLGKIYSEITYNGKRVRTHLGYSVAPKDWTAVKGEVKPAAIIKNGGKVIRGSDINISLKQIDSDVAELFAGKCFPVLEDVKAAILNRIGGISTVKRKDSLFDILERRIKEKDISSSRVKSYKVTLRYLRDYAAHIQKAFTLDNFTLIDLEGFYIYIIGGERKSINYGNAHITKISD